MLDEIVLTNVASKQSLEPSLEHDLLWRLCVDHIAAHIY